MQLPDPKALEALLKALRANGVLQYNTPDLQLVLTEVPTAEEVNHKSVAQAAMEALGLSGDEPDLTEEELLAYSDAPTIPEE